MIARSHWYWCSNHLGTLVCSILIPTWTDLSSIHRWAALREETSQQLLQPVVQLSTPRSGPTADGNLQRLTVPIFSAGNALIVLVPLLDSLDFASPIFWYLLMPACPVTKSAQCPLHLWEFGSVLENNYHQLSTSTICEKNMDSFIHQSKFSPLQHLHRQLCCHVVPWPLAPFYRNPAKNTNQSLEDVGRPTTDAAGNGELWPTKTIEVLKPAKLIKHGQTKQLPNVKSIKNGGKTSSHEV